MPLTPGVHLLAPTVPCTVFQATEAGPTALIQAGIHGDEIAGVHALQELLEEGLAPTSGRLLLVPVMNTPAYRERKRACSGGDDLNRSFPGDPNSDSREVRLAHVFMQLVLDERPDLVATLHESKTRYSPDVHPSFGQTLVYGVQPCPPMLTRAVEALNANLKDAGEVWATHHYPVSTSSTEVIVDAVGCVGTCVETWMGYPERRRIDMQKEVVLRLLEGVGVL
jgi:hypothetical protein